MNRESRALVVAIDGPAAAGKGTLARRLAQALDFAYLDTGSLYRAVGARLLAEGLDPEDSAAAAAVAKALKPEDLARSDLRAEATGAAASKVAALPEVRRALLSFQRGFATTPPEGKFGTVLDGRDIGTIVCPEAQAKLFVTATLEERARRRTEELRGRGELPSGSEERIYARVLAEMQERDARDSDRATAPLKAADDALVIDTTGMKPDVVFDQAMAFVAERRGRSR